VSRFRWQASDVYLPLKLSEDTKHTYFSFSALRRVLAVRLAAQLFNR
jgi:hypothetical protein